MRPEIQRRFDLVERQRMDIQGRVAALSDAQLDWTPNPSAWSVRQIVQHLVLSDETLGRAHPAGTVPTEDRTFRLLPRAWRRALVQGALERDIALPLPSPAVEPRGDAPLPALLSRWGAARGEMCRALDTLGGDEPRYSHPVLGPLTAGQMLDLAQAHVAYHARQAEALLRDRAFPLRAAQDRIALCSEK